MRLRYVLYSVTLVLAFYLFLNGLNVTKRNANNDRLTENAVAYFTQEHRPDRGESLGIITGQVTHSNLRIIYNRVPKCGSRSALKLFETLSVKNGFKVIEPKKNFPYALDEENQKTISDLILSLEPPFLYHRHVHYVNFTRLGGPPVIYINLIRDPVSRAVSHFYFRRHGDGILGKSRLGKPIDRNEKNKTYGECVMEGHRECTGNWGEFFIVPFFCGHISKCRSPSRWALEQAKQCVIKNYLVVGLVEEFDDFVKVLEKLLPRFFKGAYKTWKIPDTTLHRKAAISQTRNKQQPSENVIAIAKERMTLEYEFYDFIKERFHTLKKELAI